MNRLRQWRRLPDLTSGIFDITKINCDRVPSLPCWSQKTVFVPAGRNIEDSVPCGIELTDCLRRLGNTDFWPAVMEFDKQLLNAKLAFDKIRQNGIFRAFDIHLEQVNAVVPKDIHDAFEPVYRRFDDWPKSGPLYKCVRNMRGIVRRTKRAGPIKIRNPVGVKFEFPWHTLSPDPFDGPRRWIETVNRQPIPAN
jgi:hypothetical protein